MLCRPGYQSFPDFEDPRTQQATARSARAIGSVFLKQVRAPDVQPLLQTLLHHRTTSTAEVENSQLRVVRFGRDASRELEHVPMIDVHRCNGFAAVAIASHQAPGSYRSKLTDVPRRDRKHQALDDYGEVLGLICHTVDFFWPSI